MILIVWTYKRHLSTARQVSANPENRRATWQAHRQTRREKYPLPVSWEVDFTIAPSERKEAWQAPSVSTCGCSHSSSSCLLGPAAMEFLLCDLRSYTEEHKIGTGWAQWDGHHFVMDTCACLCTALHSKNTLWLSWVCACKTGSEAALMADVKERNMKCIGGRCTVYRRHPEAASSYSRQI